MQRFVVRYRTKPDRAEENAGLIADVFAELEEIQPDGLRYASFRLEDGVSFVHVAELDSSAEGNPLGALPAFQAFTATIADRCDDPPDPQLATLVGSYRF